MWYVIEYYLSRKAEILPFPPTWMNLKDMLNEINQTHYIISLIRGIPLPCQKDQISKREWNGGYQELTVGQSVGQRMQSFIYKKYKL